MTEYCVLWIPTMAQDCIRVINEGPLTVRIPGDTVNSFYHLHSYVESRNDGKCVIKVEVIKYQKRNPHDYFITKLFPNSISGSFANVSELQFRVFNRDSKRLIGAEDICSANQLHILLTELRSRWRRKRLHKALSCSVRFCLMDSLSCGVAKFEVSGVDNSKIYNATKIMMCRHIVSHFHRHHFHDVYVYTPCFYQKNIDIHENDNDSLLNFIEELHDDMAGKLDGLYADYESIDNSSDRKDRSEKIRRRDRKRKKRMFYENCHNMAGQLVFIKALIDAKENTCCRKDVVVEGKEKFSTYACVLDNISAGVDALRSKIRYHHDSVDLQKAAIISYISLAVGIISLVVALISIDWN